jgi:hypothetical protein
LEASVLFALIKAGILGEEPELEQFEDRLDSLNVQAVRALAVRHDVVLTVYAALPKEKGEQPLQRLCAVLRQDYAPAFAKSVNQNLEGQALLDAFEQAGIDCIPLKGWVLRELYADPMSRSMADIDILVREFHQRQIRGVMEKLGYTQEQELTWREAVYRKDPYLHVEIHRRIAEDAGSVRAWEEKLWNEVSREEDRQHLFCLSDEDFFLLHLLHMHKDFRNGVLGFRRLADMWIFRKKHPKLDEESLREELRKMRLDTFAQRMEMLSQICFEGKPLNPDSELLLRFAMKSGVFGEERSFKVSNAALRKERSHGATKTRAVLYLAFPSLGRMKARFPILEKWPILLPFCWAVRIIRQLVRSPAEQIRNLNYSEVSEEEIREIRRVFRAGGVLPEEKE